MGGRQVPLVAVGQRFAALGQVDAAGLAGLPGSGLAVGRRVGHLAALLLGIAALGRGATLGSLRVAGLVLKHCGYGEGLLIFGTTSEHISKVTCFRPRPLAPAYSLGRGWPNRDRPCG
ncbi:hypothetical protein SCOCK_350013 [Actinacidiphila cocklensis]|uniref:Uncharacterized protein n=1 Tax=Actinacidiphila cocklensis TaxID=887465 RepID=A0A9W4DQA2_9ACTN|nr:hypothetical protein SCOCK_350013 [Actinacidiphila cocklensis]